MKNKKYYFFVVLTTTLKKWIRVLRPLAQVWPIIYFSHWLESNVLGRKFQWLQINVGIFYLFQKTFQ